MPGERRVPAHPLAGPIEAGVGFAQVVAESAVELVGEPGRYRRCAHGSGAADVDRRVGALGRPGWSAVRLDVIVRTGEAEPLVGTGFGPPQPSDDPQLLGQPVESLTGRREADPEGLVLALIPPGAQAELDPPATHLIHAGDDRGEQ